MIALVLLAALAQGKPAPELSETVFHVLSLPHTAVEKRFSPCAFTQKVYRLCKMLKSLGLRSVLYANEGSAKDCSAYEEIFTNDERQLYFGSDENWQKHNRFFEFTNATGIELYRVRTIAAVKRQVELDPNATHILLATFGYRHQPIQWGTGLPMIETGIGYNGSFADYRVYESYSWRNTLTSSVNYYHTVIPNCYYPEEFVGAEKQIPGRYLAFAGRLNEDKGIFIAVQILETMPEDYTLHFAGQGYFEGILAADHPMAHRVFYHGVLNPTDRNNLVAGAEALIAPTTYREPFGGTMVEAMMLGTPVITMDHGAMVETIWHGVTGFRCFTMRCFAAAARKAHTLDRKRIAQRAREMYDCNRVQDMYADYFRDVLNLWDIGWNVIQDPGHLLDVKEFYPPPSEPTSCSPLVGNESEDSTCGSNLSADFTVPMAKQPKSGQAAQGISRNEVEIVEA
eukprot:gb/GEZN01006968.1/.p1 GENE.gb/GEZN01006968.1/~~gb/GEZN01006968.1/.p1  ORF type:complete len:478 (+),score=54.78 gb/GEZN01006968.1/:70-1434(+)